MFLEKLSQISERMQGVRALALVDKDGISVESMSTDPDLDLELLAAELVTQARSMAGHSREIDVGEVRQFSITTDRAILMMNSVTSSYYLLLVLEPESNFGRARFELRRARLTLEEELVV